MPERLVRSNTPWEIQTDSSARQEFVPRIAENAVLRLYWICLLCVVLAVFSAIFQSLLQPDLITRVANPVVYLTWIFVLLFTLAIGVIRHYHLLPAMAIMNLGLVFEVLVAFAICLERNIRTAGQRRVDSWNSQGGSLDRAGRISDSEYAENQTGGGSGFCIDVAPGLFTQSSSSRL
jgi:hypothetical protein